MIILVTGGSGLVGYAIKEICNEYNHNFKFLSSKDCNLEDLNETQILFDYIKPDYVIHLAAYVGGLFKNMNSKVDMLEKNLKINYNVIKCCHDFNVKKCVSCLSTCIFPDKTSYPIDENMLHEGPPHDSNYTYSYAKRFLEIHSRAYREQYDDNFVCIIPTNIYGPNDNFNLEDSHVIPGLIHNCYLSKKKNKDFIVRGTGKPLRQFIYSIDLAKLIMWTLQNYNSHKSLILSVNEKEEMSISQIAELIADKFDYKHRIKYDPSYSDGQYKKTADNSKLESLINFNFTEIKNGINDTVDWFLDNQDIVRK
jgi:GDP-L-fucose synthase